VRDADALFLAAAEKGMRLRCSVFLLYWYKSTNTDAAGMRLSACNADALFLAAAEPQARSVSICTFVPVKQ
jgi:hypothetical protein